MNKKKGASGAWRGLTSVFACLLALVVGATSIAQANASFINGQLGIVNYKIVDKTEGEAKDAIYYKSEFGSLPELVAAKEALAQEIASEGDEAVRIGVVISRNPSAFMACRSADTTLHRITIFFLTSGLRRSR